MNYLCKCQNCGALLFWNEEENQFMRQDPVPDPNCLCKSTVKICTIKEQGFWPKFDEGIRLKDKKLEPRI